MTQQLFNRKETLSIPEMKDFYLSLIKIFENKEFKKRIKWVSGYCDNKQFLIVHRHRKSLEEISVLCQRNKKEISIAEIKTFFEDEILKEIEELFKQKGFRE